jgi:isopenicillin-N N-acyltransferase like protein
MTAAPAFPVIHVEGSAHARGVSYGSQAMERIGRSLAFYGTAVAPSLGATFGQIVDGVTQRLPLWRGREPEIVAEIEGIAEGSGFDVGEILALNTRGMFVVPPAIQREAKAANDGCTSFAVMPEASRDGHLLTGQNWDYLEGIADTIVLVHLRPDRGPSQLMIVEAGQVGRHGANSAGIALHANGLSSRLRDPSALPSTFMRRRILRSGNITEAIEAITVGPRAGSTNFLLTHRDGFAIDLETMPATVRWLFPEDGWIFHTNHYQAEIPPELADSYAPSADSLLRYGRGARLMALARARGGITRADLEAILTDHLGDGRGLCSHADPAAPLHERWMTVATVITDLTEGVMSVAAGPPCGQSFMDVDVETGTVIAAPAQEMANVG